MKEPTSEYTVWAFVVAFAECVALRSMVDLRITMHTAMRLPVPGSGGLILQQFMLREVREGVRVLPTQLTQPMHNM